MVGIYVLALEQGKYYIGKTYKTIQERYAEHTSGYGSGWTKRYKVLGLVEAHENCSDYDEDKYTKIYMGKYGIENVRGGAYCRINMPCNQIKLLKREIYNAENKCLECGSMKHYVNRCPDFVEETSIYKAKKTHSISYLECIMACIIIYLIFFDSNKSTQYLRLNLS